jgi:hypothetical protein
MDKKEEKKKVCECCEGKCECDKDCKCSCNKE